MIYQQDPEFPEAVKRWGCYLLAFCERMATTFDKEFTYPFVLDLLYFGQINRLIDSEITLLSPQGLCNHLVGVNRVMFLGKFPPQYFCRDDEFEIVCYHKNGASFNHFCSGNGKGMVLYDPWGATGSDSVRNGDLIGKRIYRIS